MIFIAQWPSSTKGSPQRSIFHSSLDCLNPKRLFLPNCIICLSGFLQGLASGSHRQEIRETPFLITSPSRQNHPSMAPISCPLWHRSSKSFLPLLLPGASHALLIFLTLHTTLNCPFIQFSLFMPFISCQIQKNTDRYNISFINQ